MRRDLLMAGPARLIPAVPALAGSLYWALEVFVQWMMWREGDSPGRDLDIGFSVAGWAGVQAVGAALVAVVLLTAARVRSSAGDAP